jgi:mono/diheme cytochrome c family protein
MKDARGFAPIAIVVALALLGLHYALRPDLTRRNWELFPDMVQSVACESFAADEFLPGGTTQQAPVDGVVVRGAREFAYGVGPEEAKRAGAELVNPFARDDALALERGQRVYNTYCIVCHDAQGNGRGSVVSRGMTPPPSLHGVRALGIADGEMFHIVTRGQGNMASYAAQIAVDDRWKAILWVRRLQQEAAR